MNNKLQLKIGSKQICDNQIDIFVYEWNNCFDILYGLMVDKYDAINVKNVVFNFYRGNTDEANPYYTEKFDLDIKNIYDIEDEFKDIARTAKELF